MSSVPPHPPRKQLCNRYWSNKHTRFSNKQQLSGVVRTSMCIYVLLRSAKLTATDQKCCILPKFEEQSLTCGSQSSSVEDQPQCRGMWHSSSPSARSLSRSPSPSFTQSPSLPRSLVCDGQTSPHRPLLVVSRSTCPPLSPPPYRTAL